MRLEYYQEMEDKKFNNLKNTTRKRGIHENNDMSIEEIYGKRRCETDSTEKIFISSLNKNEISKNEEIENRKREQLSDSEEVQKIKRRNISDEVDVLSTSILNASKHEARSCSDRQNKSTKTLKSKLLQNSKTTEERLINSIIELRKRGNELLKIGDYHSAIDNYTDALKISGKYSQLSALNLSNRALALMKLNRFADALGDCDNAIALNNREIKAKLRRIKCLIELTRFVDAKSAVLALKSESQLDECDHLLAVVIAKQNFSDLFTAAANFEQNRHFPEALSCYNDAIELDCSGALIFQSRARVLFQLGRYRDALNNLNEALRLNPLDSVGPIFNRIGCLLKLERFSEAIRDAEELNKREPRAEHSDLLRAAVDAEKRANKRNYYELLGVDRRATVADIKRQYRKMALVFHPDKLTQGDAHARALHEEKFKRLTMILQTLTDPTSRRMYDMGL